MIHPPRQWQAQALPICLDYIAGEREPSVVRAIMGSGKSWLIAAICAAEPFSTIIVTTPTIKLVEQLRATIAEWLPGEAVGAWYTHEHTIGRVTVTCHPSALSLVQASSSVDLWIADEAHKTENDQIRGFAACLPWGCRRLALTATPWGASKDDRLYGWTGELLYDYGPQQAWADGVVVKPVYIGTEECDDGKDAIDVALRMTRDAVGPGIWSARDIAHAEEVAAAIYKNGHPAHAIHSRLRTEKRDSLIDWLSCCDLSIPRALVHVALLSEGVDFPWLRWLCLLRPIGSRTLFAQQVGRALRAFPGKTEAIIYDPHGLNMVHRLSWEALLGGEAAAKKDKIDRDAELEAVAKAMLGSLKLGLDGDREPDTASFTSPVDSYLRQMALAFAELGIIKELKTSSKSWRRKQLTAKQSAAAERCGNWRDLHDIAPAHLEGLERCVEFAQTGVMSRGAASDLLTVVFALQRRKIWPKIGVQTL